MITKEKLQKYIYDYIATHFGKNEADDPCYDIEMMADYIMACIEEED